MRCLADAAIALGAKFPPSTSATWVNPRIFRSACDCDYLYLKFVVALIRQIHCLRGDKDFILHQFVIALRRGLATRHLGHRHCDLRGLHALFIELQQYLVCVSVGGFGI
jgi:hypothetical protein